MYEPNFCNKNFIFDCIIGLDLSRVLVDSMDNAVELAFEVGPYLVIPILSTGNARVLKSRTKLVSIQMCDSCRRAYATDKM